MSYLQIDAYDNDAAEWQRCDILGVGSHDGTWVVPVGPIDDESTGPAAPILVGICPETDLVSNEPVTEAWEVSYGQVGIMRRYSYNGSVPSALTPAFGSIDVGKRTTWLSISNVNNANMAAGTYDANLVALANNVGSHPMYLTYNHEPENDPGATAAGYVAAYQHFYDVVKAANPLIKIGPVFMDWTFDPVQPYGDPWSWVPDPNRMDFMGVDTYNVYHFTPRSSTSWWDTPFARQTNFLANRARAEGVKGQPIPVGVGEFGTANWETSGVSGHPPDDGTSSPVGTRKVAWIQQTVDYWANQNCFGMCYFNTLVNGDVDPSMKIEYDALTTAYWQSLSAAHAPQ